MKIIQLILRIIFSPIIFFIPLCIMIFPGIILFGIGLLRIFIKLLGNNSNDDYKELFEMSFSFILFPIYTTKEWIINADLNL